MKVSRGDLTYHINFSYAEDDQRRRVTDCAIVQFNERTRERRVVARGSATCHPRDHYKKEIGREVALKRALDPVTCGIDRDVRGLLWSAYWTRSRPAPAAFSAYVDCDVASWRDEMQTALDKHRKHV